MRFSGHLQRQGALLEMNHSLRPHFVSSGGKIRCEFKHISDNDIHHEAWGNTEEAAFREAIKTFVARKSKSDQLKSDNEDLRKRLADLESQLEAQQAANNAKPNGSRKKTDQANDAVSSGTF